MCIVLKIGGSLKEQGIFTLSRSVLMLQGLGCRAVVVHGGGPRISQALAEQGIHLPFENGLRVTTPEAMSVVERVLAVEVNAELVSHLKQVEIPAVGINGAKGIIEVDSSPANRTGVVKRAHTEQLATLLQDGKIPVVAPIGYDMLGFHYNINADLAASAIAGALGAKKIIFYTDVSGIYADWERQEQLFDVRASALWSELERGAFSAGMIPKVNAVLSALTAGVTAAYVVDGTDEASLTWAVMDNPEARGDEFLRTEYGTRVTI